MVLIKICCTCISIVILVPFIIFVYTVGCIQHVLPLPMYVINNIQYFKLNSDIHNINTRNNLDLHYPLAHLSVYQKGLWFVILRPCKGPFRTVA
jgi:hypothetical protein